VTHQIVFSVVASTPNSAEVFAILHCTVEMGACRREGPQIPGNSSEQNNRLRTEFDNLTAILWYVGELANLDTRDFDLTLGWRFQVCEHGIEYGAEKCSEPSGKNPFKEVTLLYIDSI
jgi:hypothetical protein